MALKIFDSIFIYNMLKHFAHKAGQPWPKRITGKRAWKLRGKRPRGKGGKS